MRCSTLFLKDFGFYQIYEHRDELKARMQLDKGETESVVARALQAQQALEMEKLKVALANETANAENEREAKQQGFKER